MARTGKTIKVPVGSDLARLLDEAEAAPVLLERDGARYRLSREEADEEDIWASYDPEQVRAAVKKLVGSWRDLDTDAMIADIYRAREEGSRPASRP